MFFLRQLRQLCVRSMISPTEAAGGAGGAGGELDDGSWDAKAEWLPHYVAEAAARGMDVNDYMEQEGGWGDCTSILEETAFPLLRPGLTLCELGPGSGRYTRHLAARLEGGTLHLVEHSPWKVNFLREYFAEDPRVHVHLNDGLSLPFLNDASVDLIVSYGTFTYLELGVITLYAREFARVLRPGGLALFDYWDTTDPESWKWLEAHLDADHAACFTYHHPETIRRVFQGAGLEVVAAGYYTTVRRPEAGQALPPLPPLTPGGASAAAPVESGDIKGFGVSAVEQLQEAAAAGLSLPDYLDQQHGTREHTGYILGEVARFGVFEPTPRRVCEIGTGTGMFTETFRARWPVEHYESYEPDPDWAAWLAEQYGVLSQACDGHSLAGTPDASLDVVHAHGVFIYLAFLTSVQYFEDMARVLRSGGYAFFDIMSEDCMTDSAVAEWLASEWRFPVVLPREYVKEQFARHGCDLVGDFVVPFMETRPSHYLIFRKR